MSRDNFISYDPISIISNNYHCKICTKIVDKGTVFNCGVCEYFLCELCYQLHTHNIEFLTGKEKKVITIPRFLGLEIEAEGKNTEKLANLLLPEKKRISLTYDGSLKQPAIEVLTQPASLDELEKSIDITCNALQKANYRASKNCGLHIHIDARDIKDNPEKIIAIVQTYYAIEDMIYSMIPPSRWISKYCKRLSDFYKYKNFDGSIKIDKLESIWYKTSDIEEKHMRKSRKYDNTRYVGFNLHSLFYRGTIELRYHSGTIQQEKMLMWCEMMLKIFDWAINRYDPKVVTNLYNMETSYSKLDYMQNVFGFNESLYMYLTKRMEKFNRNFCIKFNKGDRLRKEEEIKNTLYVEKLQKKYQELFALKNKVKRTIYDMEENLSHKKKSMSEEEKMKLNIVRKILENEREKYYGYERELQHLKVQIDYLNNQEGFIKSEEIYSITSILQASRYSVQANETDYESLEEMDL